MPDTCGIPGTTVGKLVAFTVKRDAPGEVIIEMISETATTFGHVSGQGTFALTRVLPAGVLSRDGSVPIHAPKPLSEST